MTWANDVRRAKETLDWIEARQGPLPEAGYARIETDVRTVRAMAEGQDDDARISEIRAQLAEVVRRDPEWTFLTEDVPYLLARLDALAAEAADVARENEALIEEVKASGEQIAALADERDALRARAERAEAALFPCTLALEYRDGVTCREERDKGVCLNHRVIAGLRVHAVTADRLEIENRALRRQVRASYGIIHEGLHGGKPTDPDHQEACEMPSCRNASAVLAGSREQSAGDGA